MAEKNNAKDIELERALTRRDKEKYYDLVQWYAVYVHPQHELQVYDYLMGLDDGSGKNRRHRGKAKEEDLIDKIDQTKVLMQCYVPVIRQHLKYSDRMVWKEKVQTPGIIFVHTKLNDREPLFNGAVKQYVTTFMNDRDKHRPISIPDEQMSQFMALVESKYAINIDVPSYEVGQKVLVLEGPLTGRVAELVDKKENISRTEFEKDREGKLILDAEGNPIPKHKVTLCVRLNAMLAATFEIDSDKVVPAPQDAPDYTHYD